MLEFMSLMTDIGAAVKSVGKPLIVKCVQGTWEVGFSPYRSWTSASLGEAFAKMMIDLRKQG